MKKNYVSNSQESVRMFKNDFLESLSKVHFTVPLFIFIPVILFCVYQDVENRIALITFFGLFVLGLFVWTFTEYIMHRYIFHYMPDDKPWAQRIHFIFHGDREERRVGKECRSRWSPYH